MNALSAVPQSRKLTGLVITIGALLVLVLIAIVAGALWNVSDVIFTSIGGFITTLGGSHQAAQAVADRSANYNTQLVPPPPVVLPPQG